MKKPTQFDVARRAGVSRATVSYVLNSATNGQVSISDETRHRVLDAIEELGYIPDARARALRSGDTKTLGLIMPDIRNPHFWQTAEAIAQEAREAGYNLLLSDIALKRELANEIFADLSHRRIDGLILCGGFTVATDETNDPLGPFLKRHLPIVEISDHYMVHYDLDRVSSNYYLATKEAIAYLLNLNHQRIALLFGVAMPELADDRLQPYMESLVAAGISVEDGLVVRCGPTMEEGYRATSELLTCQQRPTAIVAINDLLAMGAMRAIDDAGLRIPGDISLMGFDDIPMAQYLLPRLTTVSKDITEMCRVAVRLLLARIKEPDRPHQTEDFPARLIIRESTGPAPQ